MVFIQYFRGSSLFRKLRKFLTNSIWGHVVEIYLVMLPCKISYVLVTFGPLYFMTTSSLSRSAMCARSMITRYLLHLLLCISSSLLVLLKNGALNLWHVTHTWTGVMVILLSLFNTLLSGSRGWPHLTTLAKRLHTFSSSMLSLGLVYHKR